MAITAAPNNSAFLSKRKYLEPEEPFGYQREPYQRDRDRIIHSRSFRRLMHKTQIFNANYGDHYRNRLTHTLEVSQIARTIGKRLGLNDELIEAIALGHDLGHTPFGHVGERTLHEILMQGLDPIRPINEGFKHNFQSVHVVDNIELRGSEYSGINLTLAVREGIIKHTKVQIDGNYVNYSNLDLCEMDISKPYSFTLEGQVVSIADEIAQCTHDIEDGVRSRIIDVDELFKDALVLKMCDDFDVKKSLPHHQPALAVRNTIIRWLVGFLIQDVCKTTTEKLEGIQAPDFSGVDRGYNDAYVSFSNETKPLVQELKKRIDKWIISSLEISQSDSKAIHVIKQIFLAYYSHPKQLPDYILRRYYEVKGFTFSRAEIVDKQLQDDPQFVRLICDHIAGMTDQFAAREFNKLYVPEYF